MANKTIAIVGAGASGLLCAITAKRRLRETGKNAQVIVYERNRARARSCSLRGTGGATLPTWSSRSPLIIRTISGTAAAVLGAFPVEDILQFFETSV